MILQVSSLLSIIIKLSCSKVIDDNLRDVRELFETNNDIFDDVNRGLENTIADPIKGLPNLVSKIIRWLKLIVLIVNWLFIFIFL